MKCPNCAFENPADFKFCGNCGTRLVDSKIRDSAHAKAPSKAEAYQQHAERRHITVMFCDLVGSTSLAEQLDPEEFREILRAYQDVSSYVIASYEGHLAQYLGDGILVYFGFPKAHEDDTQRAVRSALEIVEEMEKLSQLQQREKGIDLALRIGIHTGLVVLGEIGGETKHELLALGKTPNIAARIQGLAHPNTVVVSSNTYGLIKNFFDCQSIGSYEVKGVSRPIEVFQVIQESDVRSRLDVAITTKLSPMVGREVEVTKLLGCWEHVKKGAGQVALVIGEPGIGKTRLLQVFEEQIKDEPHTWMICSCLSYYSNSAFHPIINLIQKQLNITSKDSNKRKLTKIKKELTGFNINLQETIPLLASLLSIPTKQPQSLLSLSPQKQKQKILEILLDLLMQISQRRPLLFVIENLHWADASTLEHVSHLMESVSKARILVILTFHPKFRAPQSKNAKLTEIMLRRLARKQVEVMISEVTGGKSIPEDVIDLVLEKTDGIPLFIEELTKMLIESGLLSEDKKYDQGSSLAKVAIPDTLQDTLMARLDRLGAVKEVVQIAAVLGREFTFDLINAVTPFKEEILKEELNSLVEAEILDKQDEQPNSKYIFKQTLIQDAAYNSLLKSTRQHYHRMVANIIEEKFPALGNTNPEIIAYHYAEAEMYVPAIKKLIRAGELALKNSANLEAIAHLSKALNLLTKVPDSKEKIHLELQVHMTRAVPLLATRGFSAPEVKQEYEQARELSQQLGDIPSLFPALHGLYRYYLLSGNIKTAIDLSDLLLSWAQTAQKPDFLLEAHRAVGTTLFHSGDPTNALKYLKQGMILYNPGRHANHAILYGTDPKIVCLSYASLAEIVSGYPDQALQSGREAITWAKEIDHPFSQAMALNHHAWFHQYRQETEKVKKNALELIELSKYQYFAFWLAAGTIFLGWVVAQTNKSEGINQMINGIEGFEKTGARLVSPYFLSLVAEVYLSAGQIKESRKYLRQAETIAKNNKERFYDAEICRLKGELNSANSDIAEKYFKQALDSARRQYAKSFELRGAMSLARLWHNQGRKDEALELLQGVYGWFKEGFDTADLIAAKQMIEELS